MAIRVTKSNIDKTEIFINKAKIIHGDKYDYSKVLYKKAIEIVIITCPEHGDFEQTPNSHLNGSGCKVCSRILNGIKKTKLARDRFIIESNERHNNKYDYSKFKYIKSDIKSIIICPYHGEFEQTPNGHLSGGCVKCGLLDSCNLRRKYTSELLIEEINKIYGDSIDTTLCEYKGSIDSKVTLICNKEGHGIFQKTPYDLINRKRGCPLCTKRPRIDTEYFKILSKEIHGDKYIYDKVEYVNANTNVIITCRIHGDFPQTKRNHIDKMRGCPHCNGGIKLTWEFILKKIYKIHGDKYDYSKFIYDNFSTKSTIICKIHGEWEQNLNNHINGKGCPHCQNKTEGILNLILKDNFNYKIIHNRGFDWCRKNKMLRYDFIIEDLKCIIELDGRQHFKQVCNWESPEKQLINDIFKNDCALKNGYSIIRVFQEDIFKNKNEIILKLILSIQRYSIPQLICIGEIYNNRFSNNNRIL